MLDVVLPVARPLPGGSRTLLPAASTWAGEEQRSGVYEGPHFLNGVRRRGQRVLGAQLGFQSPRLHKGVTKYDSSFDLADTLRLTKESGTAAYGTRQALRGFPSPVLWRGHPRGPVGTLPR